VTVYEEWGARVRQMSHWVRPLIRWPDCWASAQCQVGLTMYLVGKGPRVAAWGVWGGRVSFNVCVVEFSWHSSCSGTDRE
jgi:hypothetical protein